MEMTPDFFAACNLSGNQIGEWHVHEIIDVQDGKGVADYAMFYKVRNGVGEEYLMKVLDLYQCYRHPLMKGQRRSEIIEDAMRYFRYERRLAEHCKNKSATRVISYVDSGEIEIESYPHPVVSYIVYEKSNDVQTVVDFSKKVNQTERIQTLAEKLKLLHDVTTGLHQLHGIQVSPQDLSPSKVLAFREGFKLGDLSRALCLEPSLHCPFALDDFNGKDYTYAPPEVFFNHKIAQEDERLYQVDNYMLGSLIVYYLTGLSYNVFLERNLPMSLRDMSASGMSFKEVEAYLTDAHANAIINFKDELSVVEVRDGIVGIVNYLCNPIPEHRGHPKIMGDSNKVAKSNLERTISQLDLLRRKAELALIR